MSTDFLSAVIDGLETAGALAVWWVALSAAVVVVVAGCRAQAAIARRRHVRREIDDLERRINNPAVRAKYLNQPREEER